MSKVTGKLTVFFEGPFWVGVFERAEDGRLTVCRVVFGAEPRDYEVWEFVLKNYDRLKFSPPVEAKAKKEPVNPKRLQREAKKQLQGGVGTRSQQALQMQREEKKMERKTLGRAQKLAEQERRFQLKQQKRRDKHRGR